MQQNMPELPDLGEFDPLANATLDGDMNAARWRNDHKLTVRFHRDAVLNPHRSAQENRPIYDEVDFVTIWTPGSQNTVIDAPVKSGFYMQRFGDKYKKWLETQQNIESGTPLESFPFLSRKVGLIAELKGMQIHTVEQLAGLHDGQLGKLMGGFELRKKAADWLEATAAGAADAEKQAMAKRLEELEQQLQTLMQMGITPQAAVPQQLRRSRSAQPAAPAPVQEPAPANDLPLSNQS